MKQVSLQKRKEKRKYRKKNKWRFPGQLYRNAWERVGCELRFHDRVVRNPGPNKRPGSRHPKNKVQAYFNITYIGILQNKLQQGK